MESGDGHTTVTDLKATVARFVKDREWERFHTPRNLAESICIESAELLELFQWSDQDEAPTANSPPMLKKLEEELADVLIYCIAIANATGIDVTTAILNKMKRNEEKYPTERYKGTYSKPEK